MSDTEKICNFQTEDVDMNCWIKYALKE